MPLRSTIKTYLSLPLYTSVTFWEVTAPVKLPTTGCLYKKLSNFKK